jgi:hypothetical protein
MKENVFNFVILGGIVLGIILAGRTSEGSKRIIKKTEEKTMSYTKLTGINIFTPWAKQLPQR